MSELNQADEKEKKLKERLKVILAPSVRMQPIFLFLTSSLNAELVQIILKSITSFSSILQSDIDGASRPLNSENITILSKPFDSDAILRINKIKVQNRAIWKDAKADDFLDTMPAMPETI